MRLQHCGVAREYSSPPPVCSFASVQSAANILWILSSGELLSTMFKTILSSVFLMAFLNWFRRFGQTIPESWCNSWNATFTKYSLKSITNIDEWKFSENTILNIPAGRLWCQLGASWILRQVVILTSSPSLSCQGNMPRNSCTKQENYTSQSFPFTLPTIVRQIRSRK